jgi:hypothetical protein
MSRTSTRHHLRVRWIVPLGTAIASIRGGAVVAAVTLLTLLAVFAHTTSARAATNGKIAFQLPGRTSSSIDTVAGDGTLLAPMPGLPTATSSEGPVPADSANPAWNADGTRLAFSSTAAGGPDVYVVNADGTKPERVTHDPLGAIDPTWSPDGRSIAFTSSRNGAPDIYVVVLATRAETRLTTDPGVDQQPRWSPDGRLIAFASNRSGSLQIWTMAPDGSNQHQLTSLPGDSTDPAWSPDSKTLAFANSVNGFQSLYAIHVAGGTVRRLTSGFGTDQFPAWSPDGKRIAFTRARALYVMPAGGDLTGSKTLPVTKLGLDPVWAALPPPAAKAKSGTVIVSEPGGSGGVPLPTGTVQMLPTGTRVNATNGSVEVAFKLQAAPAAVPKFTALVVNEAFTVVTRTPTLISLNVRGPTACSPRSASIGRAGKRHFLHIRDLSRAVVARAARKKRNGREKGYKVCRAHVCGGSRGTDYLVETSCRGTLFKVTAGLVRVTERYGHHRTLGVVSAGHSLFVAGA